VSISLSAATSLDWKRQATHDHELVARLASLMGEEVVLMKRGDGGDRLKMEDVGGQAEQSTFCV